MSLDLSPEIKFILPGQENEKDPLTFYIKPMGSNVRRKWSKLLGEWQSALKTSVDNIDTEKAIEKMTEDEITAIIPADNKDDSIEEKRELALTLAKNAGVLTVEYTTDTAEMWSEIEKNHIVKIENLSLGGEPITNGKAFSECDVIPSYIAVAVDFKILGASSISENERKNSERS